MALTQRLSLLGKSTLLCGLLISAAACSLGPERGDELSRESEATSAGFLRGDGAAEFASKIFGTYRDKPSERNFFYMQIAGHLELRADGSYLKAEEASALESASTGQWLLDTSAEALPMESPPELWPMPVEGVPGPSAEDVTRVNELLMAIYLAPKALLTFKTANPDWGVDEQVVVKIMDADTLLLIDEPRQTRVYRQP